MIFNPGPVGDRRGSHLVCSKTEVIKSFATGLRHTPARVHGPRRNELCLENWTVP